MTRPILIELLGDTPKIRLLSFLIENPMYWYEHITLLKLARVSEEDGIPLLEEFERFGFIYSDQRHGRLEYHCIMSNPVMESLHKIAREGGNILLEELE